jgi:superfamily II DNA helicase RecQ
MAYRIFTIPIHDPGPGEAELNGFLGSHRVLGVERKWVESALNSYWTFCVDYLESTGAPHSRGRNGGQTGRDRVDYREKLSPADFAVYAKLRDVRRQIAREEAVPVYTVFTNEQLARMVEARVTTKAALEKIAGVGDARIEKYGVRVLDVLQRQYDGAGTHAPECRPSLREGTDSPG